MRAPPAKRIPTFHPHPAAVTPWPGTTMAARRPPEARIGTTAPAR